jgi:hypothetical protein
MPKPKVLYQSQSAPYRHWEQQNLWRDKNTWTFEGYNYFEITTATRRALLFVVTGNHSHVQYIYRWQAFSRKGPIQKMCKVCFLWSQIFTNTLMLSTMQSTHISIRTGKATSPFVNSLYLLHQITQNSSKILSALTQFKKTIKTRLIYITVVIFWSPLRLINSPLAPQLPQCSSPVYDNTLWTATDALCYTHFTHSQPAVACHTTRYYIRPLFNDIGMQKVTHIFTTNLEVPSNFAMLNYFRSRTSFKI